MRDTIAGLLRALAHQISPAPPPAIGRVVSFSHSLYGTPKYVVRVKLSSGKLFEGPVQPVEPHVWTFRTEAIS